MTIRGILSALIVVWALSVSQAGTSDLSDAASAALSTLFPGYRVVGVGVEREQGIALHEVILQDGDRKLEVEVTPDGSVVEIETVVPQAEVPKQALDGIVASAEGATVRGIERHEVRSVIRDGKVVALDAPIVFYEAKLEGPAGAWEIAVTEAGDPLAPAVRALLESHDRDDDSKSDSGSDSDSDSESSDSR